jgi:hypothetical protein
MTSPLQIAPYSRTTLWDGGSMQLSPHGRASWIVTVSGEHMGSVSKRAAGWKRSPMFGDVGRWKEAMDRAIELLSAHLAEQPAGGARAGGGKCTCGHGAREHEGGQGACGHLRGSRFCPCQRFAPKGSSRSTSPRSGERYFIETIAPGFGGRSRSYFGTFADANRAAMAAIGPTVSTAVVVAVGPPVKRVAKYVRGPGGGPVAEAVG